MDHRKSCNEETCFGMSDGKLESSSSPLYCNNFTRMGRSVLPDECYTHALWRSKSFQMIANVWIQKWAHAYTHSSSTCRIPLYSHVDSSPLVRLWIARPKIWNQSTMRLLPWLFGTVQCLCIHSRSHGGDLSGLARISDCGNIHPCFHASSVGRLCINSSRDFKRFESVQRSPMYQHFGEALTDGNGYNSSFLVTNNHFDQRSSLAS